MTSVDDVIITTRFRSIDYKMIGSPFQDKHYYLYNLELHYYN